MHKLFSNFNALPSIVNNVHASRELHAGHRVRVSGAFLLKLLMTGTADEKDKATLLVDVVCENDELAMGGSILSYWPEAAR